jgi:hypothetical protein
MESMVKGRRVREGEGVSGGRNDLNIVCIYE